MCAKANIYIKDAMLGLESTPTLPLNAVLSDVFNQMDKHKLGVVCLVKDNDELAGILTDGDIRRLFTKVQKPLAALMNDDAIKHANLSAKTIEYDATIEEAITIMGNASIWDLPVMNGTKLVGLLHLHPAIKAVLATIDEVSVGKH